LLLRETEKKPRYNIRERPLVIFHLEYFQMLRRQVTAVFGIARSTLYRWLHDIQDRSNDRGPAHNKTPAGIAALVWEIARVNIPWGRFRIAYQLAILGVFIAPSTVRRILQRPKPSAAVPQQVSKEEAPPKSAYRKIPAFYPNHVWSADLPTVRRWGLWQAFVFVVIDHYSRKVISVCPLEGPNAGWVCGALEDAFRQVGPPKHIISDQGSVFISAAFLKRSSRLGVSTGGLGRSASTAALPSPSASFLP